MYHRVSKNETTPNFKTARRFRGGEHKAAEGDLTETACQENTRRNADEWCCCCASHEISGSGPTAGRLKPRTRQRQNEGMLRCENRPKAGSYTNGRNTRQEGKNRPVKSLRNGGKLEQGDGARVKCTDRGTNEEHSQTGLNVRKRVAIEGQGHRAKVKQADSGSGHKKTKGVVYHTTRRKKDGE